MSDSGNNEPPLKKQKKILLLKEPKKPYDQYFNDKDNFVHDVNVNLTDKCLFNEIDKHYHSDIILFYNQNDGNEALEITYDKDMYTPISTRVLPAISDKKPERKALDQETQETQETQASQAVTEPSSPGEIIYSQHMDNGNNDLTLGGAPIVRRISASQHDRRARQTRVRQHNYVLHRSFFLIIWEHFAPNDDIKGRPRTDRRTPFNIKLPIYKKDGSLVCFVLLRCVARDNNIAYSVLFEFTNYIHWSIFYSFDVTHGGGEIINQQVSQFHFTLNEYHFNNVKVTPKTRMFFEYTNYINGLIQKATEAHLSDKIQQAGIMEIVSELMLLTMYQLLTATSRATGEVFLHQSLIMRQNIDKVGQQTINDQMSNIALQHTILIECIQREFKLQPQSVDFTSRHFIKDLIDDIKRIAAPEAELPGRGGKNINRYLTKINNIKEKLKLLKKNKVKNNVKITKLSKSIEELKAKLNKQKEKEKAKLKKQKEKEKAKLKKQKEKEKAKLKKQKEKDKSMRKKL